jgi:hypothetical protein
MLAPHTNFPGGGNGVCEQVLMVSWRGGGPATLLHLQDVGRDFRSKTCLDRPIFTRRRYMRSIQHPRSWGKVR